MEDIKRIKAGVRAVYPAAELIQVARVEGIHFQIGKNSHADAPLLGKGPTEEEAWIAAFDYVQNLKRKLE